MYEFRCPGCGKSALSTHPSEFRYAGPDDSFLWFIESMPCPESGVISCSDMNGLPVTVTCTMQRVYSFNTTQSGGTNAGRHMHHDRSTKHYKSEE